MLNEIIDPYFAWLLVALYALTAWIATSWLKTRDGHTGRRAEKPKREK